MKPFNPLAILTVTSPLVPAGIGLPLGLTSAVPTGEKGSKGLDPVVTRMGLAVPDAGNESEKDTVAALTSPG